MWKYICLFFFCFLMISCNAGPTQAPPAPAWEVETIDEDVAAYEEMTLPELASVLKELKEREIETGETARSAEDRYSNIREKYKSTEKGSKADALVAMLNAKAEMDAAKRAHRSIQKELFAVRKAYENKKK